MTTLRLGKKLSFERSESAQSVQDSPLVGQNPIIDDRRVINDHFAGETGSKHVLKSRNPSSKEAQTGGFLTHLSKVTDVLIRSTSREPSYFFPAKMSPIFPYFFPVCLSGLSRSDDPWFPGDCSERPFKNPPFLNGRFLNKNGTACGKIDPSEWKEKWKDLWKDRPERNLERNLERICESPYKYAFFGVLNSFQNSFRISFQTVFP